MDEVDKYWEKIFQKYFDAINFVIKEAIKKKQHHLMHTSMKFLPKTVRQKSTT